MHILNIGKKKYYSLPAIGWNCYNISLKLGYSFTNTLYKHVEIDNVWNVTGVNGIEHENNLCIFSNHFVICICLHIHITKMNVFFWMNWMFFLVKSKYFIKYSFLYFCKLLLLIYFYLTFELLYLISIEYFFFFVHVVLNHCFSL